ncbi:MAG: SpoIIE family protein phosphatase [candidate division Zixibacteria bacterium]|nr:SpoIIE family protein phosphatase [candidate division Zixibacteria bacterium]
MKRILIVEDDAAIRKGLAAALQEEQYEVLTARDGEEGYETARREKPDAIILDLMLPKKNGQDVCRDLRKEGDNVPILMLTAHSRASDIAGGLELGADDYLTKPFDVRVFLAKIKVLLKHKVELQKAADRAERLSGDMEEARRIQESLFPKKLPATSGWEFAGLCRPARSVGGDYYDIFEVAPGKVLFALGDVSGKGLGPSLLMSSVHTAIRTRAASAWGEPLKLITELNRHLLASTPPETFVTLFLGVLDLSSGRLLYVNCAHPPPILMRSESWEPARLTEGGLILGILEGHEYRQGDYRINPGDVLVLFSDGVTEAANRQDEMFEEKGLLSLLDKVRGLEAGAVLERTLAAVDGFAAQAEQADDISLVVIRRKGPGL